MQKKKQYGKCLKFCTPTKRDVQVPNKTACANSADPDQTAPEGAVWSGSTLCAIPLSILRNNCIKKAQFRPKRKKVFEILGHLPYQKICEDLREMPLSWSKDFLGYQKKKSWGTNNNKNAIYETEKSWHFMWIVCLAGDSHEMLRLVFSEK